MVLVRHVRGDGRSAGATRRTLDGTERGRATTSKHTYRGVSDLKVNPLFELSSDQSNSYTIIFIKMYSCVYEYIIA